jgi:hypothetical protein
VSPYAEFPFVIGDTETLRVHAPLKLLGKCCAWDNRSVVLCCSPKDEAWGASKNWRLAIHLSKKLFAGDSRNA